LSRVYSESELTTIARDGRSVLACLDSGERSALGRGTLTLTLTCETDVFVAACKGFEPFWLADQRFMPTDESLRNEDATWRLFHKTFPISTVRLGVNSLDSAAPGHYVVFLKPRRANPQAGDETAESFVSIDEPSSGRWKIARASPVVAPAHDVFHPFDRFPAILSDAIVVQPRHSDRHSTQLATGRVWKTRVPSTARPDQLVVSFGQDSRHELSWSWRTNARVERSVVRLARADHEAKVSATDPGAYQVVTGRSTLVEVPNLLNDALIRRHQVTVSGLEPGASYRYSVGDGTDTGWSEWHQVKTAPSAEKGVHFLYMGDAQTGLERWGQLLRLAITRHPQSDFLILAGDLVDRGNERTNWDHFFMRAAPVFPSMPLMPCVGNHEYLDMGPRLYRANFPLPANGPPGIDPGLVYCFEAGDGFFAILDSTMAVSDINSAHVQAEWLARALAHSRATWKFVIFHHPVYPSHPWRDTPLLREAWVPIFDKHGVDMVLQGHDHAYLRTYPMRGNRRVDRAEKGTTYVIAVSGDKFVDQPARDYIEVGQPGLSTYQTIETDPQSGTLLYRAWREDGSLFDELTLKKPTKGSPAALSVAGGP
jgi:hypothetical protein